MGQGLYESQPFFRREIDKVFKLFQADSDCDLYKLLYGEDGDENQVVETQYAQPLLFAVEYALAKYLIHLDIRPDAMIGHSIGELVAACISGVMSLEDAVRLVQKR